MLTRSLKPALLISLMTLVGPPAAAQIHVDLPGVEVRIGRTAPPPLRHERRPRRPGADSVWIGGAWDWQANDWAWTPGRWERPAYRNARWIAPNYRREGSAWRYEPGHWKGQNVVEGEDYRRWRSDQGERDRHGRDHDDRNGNDDRHGHGDRNGHDDRDGHDHR